MSVVRCAHCNATGHCGCVECAKVVRGKYDASKRHGNVAICDALKSSGPELNTSPLVLLFLPRAIVGALQSEGKYPCAVCNGTGYNHFGRRRG
ncbi:MAG: hypothetical protein Q8M65_04120 [Rhodoglobus sp.]|nr:hypothetical protein [Rhodoglobus sp.]